MASSHDILASISKAMETISMKVYYLIDEHCEKTNEKGEIIFYEIKPNMTSPHTVFLMHPDNLNAFLQVSNQKLWTAIDQKEYWKAEKKAFDTMMEFNAKAYNELLERSQNRSQEKAQ